MAGELRRSRVVNNLKYFLTSSAFSRELYPKYTNALALVMSSSSWGVSAANKLPQGHLPEPGYSGQSLPGSHCPLLRHGFDDPLD